MVYNQERLILDNLCNKQGNVGLKSAVYNQERAIMAQMAQIGREEFGKWPSHVRRR